MQLLGHHSASDPALPQSFQNAIGKFEPANIGNVMTASNPSSLHESITLFSPWVGMAVLAGYAVIALGVGGYRLVRRDA